MMMVAILLVMLPIWNRCVYSASPVPLRPYVSTTKCLNVHRDEVKADVAQALYVPPCSCGDSNNVFGWRRVAYLDMTDPYQTCPPSWNLRTGSFVRGCARVETRGGICESVFYSTNGLQYSKVCGKIIAYQVGNPDAFYDSIISGRRSIDEGYIDGISLTMVAIQENTSGRLRLRSQKGYSETKELANVPIQKEPGHTPYQNL